MNIFQRDTPNREEIIGSHRCAAYISLALEDYLSALGIGRQAHPILISNILNVASAETDDRIYEERIHFLLAESASPECEQTALRKRAKRIFRQISPYLGEGRTLDYGCGDGKVGRLIKDFYDQVILADTYRHPTVDQFGLPFFLLPPRGASSLPSEHFQNVLLCTVLHHSDDPPGTLAEAVRVTEKGGNILVIESVYGVAAEPDSCDNNNPVTDAFLSLNPRDQLAVNVFFDHFYNRCLHYSPDPEMKVNVPYAYLDPSGWEKELHRHGLRIKSYRPLGIDQPLAPLFHVLYVAVKI